MQITKGTQSQCLSLCLPKFLGVTLNRNGSVAVINCLIDQIQANEVLPSEGIATSLN